MFDDKEKFIEVINKQYSKFKKTQPLVNTFLLLTLWASTLYQYVSYRPFFSNLYIGLFTLFILILILIIICSNIYVAINIRKETKEDTKINPYNSWALTPKEILMLKNVYIPILEKLDKNSETIVVLQNWVKLGFVPEKDFPVEFKDWLYTKTKNEKRL